MAETPGYVNVLETLATLAWGGHVENDPIVLQRLVEYSARRVAESRGTESYAHYFLEAFRSTYGHTAALATDWLTVISGLVECYITPGARSDVETLYRSGYMRGAIWDHFKGGVYRSNRLERDADTGKLRVSYESLDHREFLTAIDSIALPTPHSRRVEQWNEVVEWPDGKYRSRFVYRGAEGSPAPLFKVHGE